MDSYLVLGATALFFLPHRSLIPRLSSGLQEPAKDGALIGINARWVSNRETPEELKKHE